MKHATLVLALLAAGCGAVVSSPLPEGPLDEVSSTADCSLAVPRPPDRGSMLAFLTSTENTIRTYSIQSSGCWVRLDEDRLIDSASGTALHSSGRFLYVSGRFTEWNPGIRIFAIDSARGALEPLEDVEVGSHIPGRPGSTVVAGDALYTISGSLGTGYHGGFWQLSIDPASGRLEWQGEAYSNWESGRLAWSPARSTLYFWTERAYPRRPSVLRAVKPDRDGRLGLVDEVETGYGEIQPDPSGSFLWFGPWNASGRLTALDVFRIEQSGALERVASLPWDRDMPVPHPTGKVLYANGPGTVEAYRVDPATGLPTLAGSVPYAGTRASLAALPSGEWLYAVSEEEVRAYRTDTTGALVERGRVLAEGGFGAAFLRVP